MLITKFVKIRWSNRNKKYYSSKGYEFSLGEMFEVKVEDLPKYSHIEVEVVCDYCNNKTKKIPYFRYTRNGDKKDACEDCSKIKQVELFNYATRKPKGYWKEKNNRLKELDNYIIEFKHLYGLYKNNKGFNLINMFKKYDHDINDAICELGYDNNTIFYKAKDYYSNLNNLAELIEPLIDRYGRFPTYMEIKNELGTTHRLLHKKENLAQIRQILNYTNDSELIDDSGYLNRSSFEYMVAQFLIHNDVTYKREQSPFPKHEGMYRSDFTFYPKESNEIHLEIWGCINGEKETYFNYNDKMNKKLDLYRKYDINLISVYPNIFLGKYEEIQERFQNIFSNILNTDLNKVAQDLLIPGHLMNDEEILHKIMEMSEDGITFPSYQQLKENNKNSLISAVLKRYNNLADFACKFGKIPHDTPMNYWTQTRIFDLFDRIIEEYGYIISKSKMNLFFKGLGHAVQANGGVLNNKLDYFEQRMKTHRLSEIDAKWLYRVSIKKGSDMPVIVSDEQQERAINILKNRW